TDGSRLDSAAQRLHLPVAAGPKLIQGDRLTLGRYVIPDVSVWAFEARPGETSPLIEGERGNYVFRLDSLYAAGTPPLAQIRDRVLAAARVEKKKVIARQRAAEALVALASAPDLLQAGRARGLPLEKLGPFTRLNPPSAIARDLVVEGAAFGLRPGQRTGVLVGTTGCFILQGIAHQAADSAAWLKQRHQQRDQDVAERQVSEHARLVSEYRSGDEVGDRHTHDGQQRHVEPDRAERDRYDEQVEMHGPESRRHGRGKELLRRALRQETSQ